MGFMDNWRRRHDDDEDMTSAWALPERGSRRSGGEQAVSIRATTRLSVTIAQPRSLEDVPAIGDLLKAGMTVILNLEDMDRNTMRRILDATSGAAYFLDAAITRIAPNTFMLLPYNADFEGGLMDALTNSGVFDAEMEI